MHLPRLQQCVHLGLLLDFEVLGLLLVPGEFVFGQVNIVLIPAIL